MVFQSFNLFAHKTVLQNVSLAQVKVRKREKEQADRRSRELLDRVGVASQAVSTRRSSPAAGSWGHLPGPLGTGGCPSPAPSPWSPR
jgi:ABC-type histidine transport system ATPase subunit